MGENKPKIVLVGVFHMNQNTSNLRNTDVDDIASNKRQEEIRELVDALKGFNPTKIAVEITTQKEDDLNKKYRDFKEGKYEAEINEVDQVVFPLASELGHDSVNAIDWMERGVGKRGYGCVHQWTKENQPEMFKELFETSRPQEDVNKTILEMYRDNNDPEAQKKTHQMYVNMARIGTKDEHVGLDWLLWWYQRNFIIFSNLSRLAESGEDRIMLLIGNSHIYILEQMIRDSGVFEVVDSSKVLGKISHV